MTLSPIVLSFLSDLKSNNSREWFGENKPQYELVKKNFDLFIEKLIVDFSDFENMDGVKLKDCSYRIYRDVRFSKNKDPYKTWLSASFSAGGRKSGLMDYYLHVEPDGKSFLGGGMYSPTPEQIQKYRQEIDYNATLLKKILGEKRFKLDFGEALGESLKKIPKGFDPEHPEAELLKRKQLFFWHKFTDEDVQSSTFTSNVTEKAKTLKPFLDFLNVAFFDQELI